MRKSPRCYYLLLWAVLLALPAPVYAQQSPPAQAPAGPTGPVQSADYRSSAPFRHFLDSHKAPLWTPLGTPPASHKDATEHLLHMTWFLGRPSAAVQLTVSNTGDVYWIRELYNYALQSSRRWLLTPTEVASLQHDLQGVKQEWEQQVKDDEPEPPLNDLVIVSFGPGKSRKTLLCDVNKLPASVRELMHWPVPKPLSTAPQLR